METTVNAAQEVAIFDGQDNLRTRRRFVDSMREVLDIPKRPHLTEAEQYLLQNITSVESVTSFVPCFKLHATCVATYGYNTVFYQCMSFVLHEHVGTFIL